MKTNFTAVSALLLTTLAATPLYAFNHNKEIDFKRNLTDIVQFNAGIDYRHNNSNLFYRHYDAGLKFKLPFMGSGWSFGANYRSVYTKGSDGHWDLEKRPYIQLQKDTDIPSYHGTPALTLTLRNREELRFKEGGSRDHRNRTLIGLITKDRYYGVRPLVTNELFYDIDNSELDRNRLRAGFELPENEYFKSSILYQLDVDRDGTDWEPTNSLILKVVF